MDDVGRARLTDFGLSTVIPDFGSAGSIKDGHAVRWGAPEVLDKEQPVSKESDVFSFAMVVIEVCACNLIFFGLGYLSIQGVQRRGTVLWYSTNYGSRQDCKRGPANTTDTPELHR